MFDWFENRLHAKVLKNWAHCCSYSFKLSRENAQPENMYDISFEKTKGVYAEATVQRVL